MKRILTVEDDPVTAKMITSSLEVEGFQVLWSRDGTSGKLEIRKRQFDLLLLDLMLPDMSGLDICKEIRQDPKLNRLPILMLTSKGSEVDRVLGLELGADDYLVKPFSKAELVARVKALLRRAEPPAQSEQPIHAGPLNLDPATLRVQRSGDLIPISALEFRLLYFLASHPNIAYNRSQLLDSVWGKDRFVTPRIVDVYIRQLREKIEPHPDKPLFLKTIRGAGYMFEFPAA